MSRLFGVKCPICLKTFDFDLNTNDDKDTKDYIISRSLHKRLNDTAIATTRCWCGTEIQMKINMADLAIFEVGD
jgi:hypothetical protein